MAKRVPEADDGEIKLKPHERVVEFGSKQMYADLSKRSEIVKAGREVSMKIEELQKELQDLQTKLTKVDEKVKGYVATKFRPLLRETEDTRTVVMKPNGIVALVIYDKVEEYRLNVLEAHKKAEVQPEEAKKS